LARGSGLTEPEDSDLDSPLSPRWRLFAPVKGHVMLENSTKSEPEDSDLDSPLSPRWRPFAPVKDCVMLKKKTEAEIDVLDACLSTA